MPIGLDQDAYTWAIARVRALPGPLLGGQDLRALAMLVYEARMIGRSDLYPPKPETPSECCPDRPWQFSAGQWYVVHGTKCTRPRYDMSD